jgi:hypothetical protein
MATGAKYVTADEAMVIAARALEHSKSAATRADARTVYAAAAQVQASYQVAYQVYASTGDFSAELPGDGVPIPDYLYNDFAGDILSRRDA